MRTKVKCELCEREISKSNISKHMRSHKKGNVKVSKIKDIWVVGENKYECPYCKKIYCKLGIGSHIHMVHNEKRKKHDPNIGYKTKGRKGTNQHIKNKNYVVSEETRKKLSKSLTGKKLSKETKEKLSLAASKNHNGGYKNVPYISYQRKNGQQITLRGSFELRFATFLDKNNIEWNYQNKISYIDVEGVKRHCLPDFYIVHLDKYVDTKGVLTKEFAEKMKLIKEQKDIDIKLVYLKDLIEIENGNLKIEDI